MKYLDGEQKEKDIVPIHMRSTEELKEIIGDFEVEMKKNKDNIPATEIGKSRAVREGKLPDCGMWWLRDRGITVWYLKNCWLYTKNPPIGEKRKWSMTTRYVNEGIPQKEEALEELINRRQFAKEQNEINTEDLCKAI
jgi:hypothetical protein